MGKIVIHRTAPGDTIQSIANKYKVPIEWIYFQNEWLKGKPPNQALHVAGGIVLIPSENPDPKASLPSPSKPPLPGIAQKLGFHESKLIPPSPSEAELRIVIHLFLEGIDPEGTSGSVDLGYKRAQIVPWGKDPSGTDRFKLFKDQAKSNAETFWNRRFRFWPPASYPHLNVGGSSAGVICTLQINYVTSKAQASSHVKCYMRAPGEIALGNDSHIWTDAVLINHDGGYADKTGTKVPATSNTLAHEVGHLLGLNHSACVGNERVCYGEGGEAWQIKNVMGAGDQVNRSNATPWLERIELHTGVAQAEWTVHTLDQRGNPLYL